MTSDISIAIRGIDSKDLLAIHKQHVSDTTEMDDVTSTTDLCMSVEMDSEDWASSHEGDARILEQRKKFESVENERLTKTSSVQEDCALDGPTVLEMEVPEGTKGIISPEEKEHEESTDQAEEEGKNAGETIQLSRWKEVPSAPEEFRRLIPILKRSLSSPEFLKNKRGVWKVLPCPDTDKIFANVSVSEPISRPARQNTVAFETVQIRCYAQTVGDNPSVSYGPPIQLDWSFEEMEPICIDMYEDTRPPRRNMRQMILSYFHRRNVLSWQYGISDEELKKAKKMANKVKSQRQLTNTFGPIMPIESALESAIRKSRRLFKGSREN